MLVRRNRPGENIDYLNAGAAAIQEGDVVALGARGIGIAGATIDPGEVGSVWVEGVFIFPKAAGALSLGADVYWDAAAKNVTASDSGNVIAGWAVQVAGASDSSALVKIG